MHIPLQIPELFLRLLLRRSQCRIEVSGRIPQVFPDFSKQLRRIKFTPGQIVCHLSLHLLLDGPAQRGIKIIVCVRRRQHQSGAEHWQQNCSRCRGTALPPSRGAHQAQSDQGHGRIPQKRTEKNGSVELPPLERRYQPLDHGAERPEIVQPVDRDVESEQQGDQIIEIVEDALSLSAHHIPHIQEDKIEGANRQNQLLLNAVRVKNVAYKDIPYLSQNLRRCEIILYHGLPNRHRPAAEHRPEQAVFKEYTADRHSRGPGNESQRKPPVPDPHPENAQDRVGEQKQAKIGKVRDKRISKKSRQIGKLSPHTAAHPLFPVSVFPRANPVQPDH